jgi:hypothetical protein
MGLKEQIKKLNNFLMVNKKKYQFRLHQGVQIGLLIGN